MKNTEISLHVFDLPHQFTLLIHNGRTFVSRFIAFINFCKLGTLVLIYYYQCIPVPIILSDKYANVNINV